MLNTKDFIQKLRIFQEKINEIDKEATKLEKRLTKLNEKRESQEMQILKVLCRHENSHEKIFPISIEDFISLIPEDIRPEVIPVWDNSGGNRIVLLRSKRIPEFAFPVWAFQDKGISSTAYKISLNIGGIPSCQFSIVCACCFHLAERWFDGSKQEYERLKSAAGEEFKEKLISVCQKNNIHTLLMRRPEMWAHGDLKKEYGIKLQDANEYMDVLGCSEIKIKIKEALSFILWERSTLKSPPCEQKKTVQKMMEDDNLNF